MDPEERVETQVEPAHRECRRSARIRDWMKENWPEALAFARDLHNAGLLEGAGSIVSLTISGKTYGAPPPDPERCVTPSPISPEHLDSNGRVKPPPTSLEYDRLNDVRELKYQEWRRRRGETP